jgi:hypothetical protein
LSALKLLQEF